MNITNDDEEGIIISPGQFRHHIPDNPESPQRSPSPAPSSNGAEFSHESDQEQQLQSTRYSRETQGRNKIDKSNLLNGGRPFYVPKTSSISSVADNGRQDNVAPGHTTAAAMQGPQLLTAPSYYPYGHMHQQYNPYAMPHINAWNPQQNSWNPMLTPAAAAAAAAATVPRPPPPPYGAPPLVPTAPPTTMPPLYYGQGYMNYNQGYMPTTVPMESAVHRRQRNTHEHRRGAAMTPASAGTAATAPHRASNAAVISSAPPSPTNAGHNPVPDMDQEGLRHM